MSKHCLQLLHVHGITLEQVAVPSHVEDERFLLHENFTSVWWGLRVPCFIDSVRSVCMQMTLSDNLQSQLLIFKPPDRTSPFIADNFNTLCFTVYTMLHWTTGESRRIELLLFISLAHIYAHYFGHNVDSELCKKKIWQTRVFELFISFLTHYGDLTGSWVNWIHSSFALTEMTNEYYCVQRSESTRNYTNSILVSFIFSKERNLLLQLFQRSYTVFHISFFLNFNFIHLVWTFVLIYMFFFYSVIIPSTLKLNAAKFKHVFAVRAPAEVLLSICLQISKFARLANWNSSDCERYFLILENGLIVFS